MNSQFPESPEDRLIDELLREQANGPDEVFLKQIEAAVDAGKTRAVKRPAAHHFSRFAIAAGIALAAGGAIWWKTQDRGVSPQVLSMSGGNHKDLAAEREKAALVAQERFNKAVRDQEDKVEERRKLLATIVRTKGIIYKGQDSSYKKSGVANELGVNSDEQMAKDDTRTDSLRSALDAQDYGDAKRDFETDKQLLLAMKLKQAELGYADGARSGRGGGTGAATGPSSEYKMQAEVSAAPQSRARLESNALAAKAPASEVASLNKSPSSDTRERDSYNKGFAVPAEESRPEQTSGDRYGTFIDQPWKTPDRDPLSTFSIDVDTASYGNVRRMIREGRTIPKDAVRIEECINAFSYHYDQPKGDGPFSVGASLAVCPWAPAHQLVRVAIKGREIETNKRPPSNLVFLVDVSGSMQSPDKLPLLKQSMATLVEQLDERDRVAIVVYAGSEGVALPSTRIDGEGRAIVLKVLEKLEAGGSTNGGAGIKRAYELAMKEKIEGGVNRVILATDGDFNVGVTGRESLVELVKDRAKGGVFLTVCGFGTGNLNDEMMDAITHDGNGNYFYIDSEREGRKVFLKNLSGTLVTIAKDVKIQVEFNPSKVGGYRLIGYANRVLRNEDFNNDKVDAGDIGAGHTVTAFYELTPPGEAAGTDGLKYQAAPVKADATDEWLTVKLRYKHPDGDESRKIEFPLTGGAVSLDKTDADFQFATAAALFGMKLRGMEEVREVAWEKVLELAKPGLADDASEDRAEFVGLVKKLGGGSHSRIIPSDAEVAPGNRR